MANRKKKKKKDFILENYLNANYKLFYQALFLVS